MRLQQTKALINDSRAETCIKFFFLNIVIGTTNSLIYYIIVSTGVAIMNYPFYVIAKLQE